MKHNSTPTEYTQHSALSTLSAMVLSCILLLLSLTGVRGQSNSEYKFRQQSVADGARYSTDDNVPQLSMDCLAANGYGQWTISNTAGSDHTTYDATGYNPSYVAGWYLLANGLYKPSTRYVTGDLTHHPGCIPPGVVQNDALNVSEPISHQVKATANLNGAVCYVWADASNQAFVVQGFSASDLDISLAFCSNPTAPMKVVPPTTSIHTFSTITTSMSGGTQHHTLSGPGSWQDGFDVACDASYLYIVYCSNENPTYAGKYQIYVTVIDLSTRAPVSGWPKRVPHNTTCKDGTRPTITCDPRNSGSIAFDVAFIRTLQNEIDEVSYGGWSAITPLSGFFWHPNVGVPGQLVPWDSAFHARIVRSSVVGGTSSLAVYAIVQRDVITHASGGFTLVYYSPTGGTGTANYVAGDLMAPPGPISSGSYPVADAPIVAFANPYDNKIGPWDIDEFHCLYQYDLGVGASPRFPLEIVRGSDVAAAWPASPDPGNHDTRLVLNQASSALESDPTGYVAAVNQMGIHVHWRTADGGGTHFYARDTGRAFDEDVEENTLVTDICTVADGSSTGSGRGGTVGATILQNRTMAIWTDPNYGFSLTDVNSGLWQPRSYGDLTHAAYIDIHVGMLDFRGESVALNVGGDAAKETVTGAPGHLTDVPYFYFNFLGDNRGSTQGVIVHGTWDYYGLVAVHDPAIGLATTLIGSPFTNGSLIWDDWFYGSGSPYTAIYPTETGGGSIQVATYTDVSSTDHPGLLTVHSGANFFCGEWTSFTLDPDENNISGNIDVLYGPSIFPISNSTFSISDTTGCLTLDGKTALKRHALASDTSSSWSAGGTMRGHIPLATSEWWDPYHFAYRAKQVILNVGEVWDAVDHSSDLTHLAFDAEYFTFFNTNSGGAVGTSELRIGNYDPTYALPDDGDGGDITFNGGLGDAIEIHMIDPNNRAGDPSAAPRNYIIENMTFNDLRDYTILVESDQEPTYYDSYGTISIASNTFNSFDPNVGYPFGYNGDATEDYPIYGIYFKNLNGEGYSSTHYGEIDVTGNQFIMSNCSSTVDDEDAENAAIVLENTTANVESNVIEDHGYTAGILMKESGLGGAYVTNSLSLLCSNTIEHLKSGCNSGATKYQSGISSRYSAGYVKLNTIADNDIGYFSVENDYPMLIFNSIGDNTIGDNVHYAIVAASYAYVDLTGVHGVSLGGDDYGAYNTVRGPSSDVNTNPGDPLLIFLQGATTDVYVGKRVAWWTAWGYNNLYVTPITVTDEPIIASNASVNLGNIDNNYWGSGVDPSSHGSSPCTNCVWNGGSTVNAQALGASTLTYGTPVFTFTSPITMPSVSCGTGWGGAGMNKGSKHISTVTDDSSDACTQLYWSGYALGNGSQWQAAFDTLKHFVETCPHNPMASAAFLRIGTAIAHLDHDGSLRAGYLTWLESVLYLNTTDPGYFCECVMQISGSLQLPHDTTAGNVSRATNITLAVWRWILLNTTCDTPYLWQDYKTTRQTQLEQWLNNVTAYKLDTTLPPLSTWGLDTVLAKHFQYAWVANGGDFGKHVASYSVSENPLHEATTLRFALTDAEYVRVEVFDVLGYNTPCPSLQKTGEGLFEPGPHQIPIDFSRCASGTYYLRITLGTGEVRTIKLVKE